MVHGSIQDHWKSTHDSADEEAEKAWKNCPPVAVFAKEKLRGIFGSIPKVLEVVG